MGKNGEMQKNQTNKQNKNRETNKKSITTCATKLETWISSRYHFWRVDIAKVFFLTSKFILPESPYLVYVIRIKGPMKKQNSLV